MSLGFSGPAFAVSGVCGSEGPAISEKTPPPVEAQCRVPWCAARSQFQRLNLFDDSDDPQCKTSRMAEWDKANGRSACIQTWASMRHSRNDYLNLLTKSCEAALKRKRDCVNEASGQEALTKCQANNARLAKEEEQALDRLLQQIIDKLTEAQKKIGSNVSEMEGDWNSVSGTSDPQMRRGRDSLVRKYSGAHWDNSRELGYFFPAMLSEQRELTKTTGDFQDIARNLSGTHRTAAAEFQNQSDITTRRTDGLGSLSDVNPNTLNALATAGNGLAAANRASQEGGALTPGGTTASYPARIDGPGGGGDRDHRDGSGASGAGGGTVGTGGTMIQNVDLPRTGTAAGRSPSRFAQAVGPKTSEERAAGRNGNSGGSPARSGGAGGGGGGAGDGAGQGGGGSDAAGPLPKSPCTGSGCAEESGAGSGGGAFASGGQLGPTKLLLEGDEKKALAELAGNHGATADELKALGLSLDEGGGGPGGAGSARHGSTTIADAESMELFLRVHGTHERALKRGIVGQVHRKL